MDVCIEYYNQQDGRGNVLYIPFEFYEWMRAQNEKFAVAKLRSFVLQKAICDITIIITPVHMPNHWGLAVIDIYNQRMMFDDGLKVPPPTNAFDYQKRALELMHQEFPEWKALKSRFWMNCIQHSVSYRTRMGEVGVASVLSLPLETSLWMVCQQLTISSGGTLR